MSTPLFPRLRLVAVLLLTVALVVSTKASVDDAQSFALQAAEQYVKEGFQVREDYWGGDWVWARRRRAPALLKGMSTGFGSAPKSKSQGLLHVYDSEGKLAEQTILGKGHFRRGAHHSDATRSYFILSRWKNRPKSAPLALGMVPLTSRCRSCSTSEGRFPNRPAGLETPLPLI